MTHCPHCGRPMRSRAVECEYPCRQSNEELKREPLPQPLAKPKPLSLLTGLKQCRRCGDEKPLDFFPRDRSRPDGRWHTCILCNRRYWPEQGKRLAFERKLNGKLERESQKTHRSGLAGLKKCPRGGGIEALPPDLRLKAQRIVSRSIAKANAEGRRLSQEQTAAITACAVSNAPRFGDSAWGRWMLARKGYLAAQRRRMEQDVQRMEQEIRLTEQRESRGNNQALSVNWGLQPWR